MSKHSRWLRPAIQGLFFVLVALIAVNHALVETGGGIPLLSSASLHALCPFGGVVSIYNLATVGAFVQKVHSSTFVLMTLAFLLAVLVGPVFCGWVCPLGTVQEWVSRLGRKLLGQGHNQLIPKGLDRSLRYLRYLVLVWVIYMTAVTGKLVFQDVDPYYTLFNFWTSEVALGGVVILVVTLVSALFVERPWCKFACPYGAVLGLSNFVRIFKVRRNSASCVACKACNLACPMNIEVSDQKEVRNHQCISCLNCTSEHACPISDTVNLQSRQSKVVSKQ